MKRWRWALLIFELFLFALILVLPQVDLPDFTFHRGSAPIAARARVVSPPLLTVVKAPTNPEIPAEFVEAHSSLTQSAGRTDSRSLLSLLCTFLC
jgi:hypothetical protein